MNGLRSAIVIRHTSDKPKPGDRPELYLAVQNVSNTERLNRELPLPNDENERKRLLDRAIRELFGGAPTAEEITVFTADASLTALDSMAGRLVHRAGLTPFTGPLTSGATKFRVLPVDSDAAKKPRTANNPARNTLGENIRLIVSRHPDGTRIVNEASIEFFSQDPTRPPPGPPQEIKLADASGTCTARLSEMVCLHQIPRRSSSSFLQTTARAGTPSSRRIASGSGS